MKPCLFVALLAAIASPARAALYTISAGVDAFVRSAAPDSNYGLGGLLNVSGATATNGSGTANGSFDVFLRFATAATRNQIDADFGAGLWRITSVSLKLSEVNSPGNNIFNVGAGQFRVQWIGGDGWGEGTGNPNMPGATGITWNTRGDFLSAATDRILGTFANPQNNTFSSNLALDSSFVADLMGDAQTSLYLTAATGPTGFNFRSHDFTGDPALFPQLDINVEAIPEPSTLAFSCLTITGLVRRRRVI